MGEKRKGSSAVTAKTQSDSLFDMARFTTVSVFLGVLILYSAITFGIHNRVSEEQKEPYMDEVFHVPQTQKYCNGIFDEWDPKITTLPGTYVMSSAILSAWNMIVRQYDFCSTYNLRMVNVFFSVVNFCLIYYTLGLYNKDMCHLKRIVSTFTIATFPILYFFSFLYYTDTISTTFLILMHCTFLNGRYGWSAIFGAYSVFVRQTNIVWVLYHGINSILEILLKNYGELIFFLPLEGKKFFLGRNFNKIKRNQKIKKTNVVRPPVTAKNHPSLGKIWRECSDDFIDNGFGYILVGIFFFLFVLFNGGIVVGDRQAHQATLNVPQIFYFALVFGTFTLPFMATRVRTVGSLILKNPVPVVLLTVSAGAIIYYNTPVHPYLLADNRHYTFYVWKRFYEYVPCFRYIWIPFYLMVWTLITAAMGVERVILGNFIFCTCINLIPQLLLEFRYFIPAYMLARISFKNVSWYELVLEFLVHSCFNFLTLHIFLNIPFQWVDTPGIQRFMW